MGSIGAREALVGVLGILFAIAANVRRRPVRRGRRVARRCAG